MDNTLDYVAIGKRIRAARKKRKWSIDKLALLSNISRPHMGHIETGATKLSLPALIAIANALEVTADELLCDSLISLPSLHQGLWRWGRISLIRSSNSGWIEEHHCAHCTSYPHFATTKTVCFIFQRHTERRSLTNRMLTAWPIRSRS